jgi:hypothetical protein
MTIRRENAQTRREPSKRSHEGGEVYPFFLPAHPKPAEEAVSFPVAGTSTD